MNENEVKTQIEQLGKQIDEKIGKMNETAEAGHTISKSNTEELQKLVKNHSELQKQFDEMATEMARKGGAGFGQTQKLPGDLLQEALEKSTDFAAFRKTKSGKAVIEVNEVKATMLTGSNANGVIVPQQVQGIIAPNLRQTSVLDLIPTANTTADSIRYIRESAYNGAANGASNAAYVAQGGTKPEDDLVLTPETADVKTLAVLMRIAKQMVDDVQGLTGYLTARIPRKMGLVKENNVLFGDGTGENLEGITTVASAFAAPSDLVVASPNRYDVIGAALLQATIAEYLATGVVMHVQDLYLMKHLKGSDGHYLFPELRELGTIDGVTVARTTIPAMKGKFLAGDFGLGAQLFQRQGLTIEFFDQDRDNVQKNLITIRVEERHALPIFRPDAFVYGTFATAITDLTS